MRKLLAAVLVIAAPAAFAQHDHSSHGGQAAAPAADVSATDAAEEGAGAVAETSESVDLGPSGGGAEKGGFKLGVSIDHSVGHGTFENVAYYSQVNGALTISPSYGFSLGSVRLAASGRLSGSFEYTQPDNSTGRRWAYSDLALGLVAPAIFKDTRFTGISVTPNVGLTVPFSLEGLWRPATSLSGGIGLARQFGKFSVGARFGASKTLYAEDTRLFTESDLSRRDLQGNQLFLCRTDAFNCGLSGVPMKWAMSGGLNAGWAPIEKLSIGLGLNLSKTLMADMPVDDEYASKKDDENGNPVIRGEGMRDMMMGTLGVSYQLTSALSASFGMGTAQPPKSSDNRRFRFPWFNFEGPETGTTSYSLTLAGTY